MKSQKVKSFGKVIGRDDEFIIRTKHYNRDTYFCSTNIFRK